MNNMYKTLSCISLAIAISFFGCDSGTTSITPAVGGGGGSTPAPLPPSEPTNLSATAGPGMVSLTWTAVSGAASYNVYRGTATGAIGTKTTIATGLTDPFYSDSTAINGTTYYYQVTAVNADGESVGSSEMSATPQANLPPVAPIILVVTVGDSSVEFSWATVPGATSYNVYRGTATGALGTKTTMATGLTNTVYNDSTVINGTTYYYQVTAVNANGESGGSGEMSAMPQANLPPVAPTILVVTAGDGTVGLSWTMVSGATSYNVYRGTATGALGTKTTVKTGLTNPVYNDSTVINGTTYYYQVTAVNANGESGGSNEKSATPTAPSAPPFIWAQAITWTTTPPAGYPVLEVEVCTDSNCNTPINNATVTINSTALTYTATDQLYRASAPMPATGAPVNLSVTIPSGWPVTAGTYTASGTQYTTIPSVTSPTQFATWNDTVAHAINWTAGSPTTASDYIVGIVDDVGTFYPFNANNNPVTVPTTTTSYTLPASSTTPGNYAVFIGIGTQGIGTGATGGISITPGAAAGSGLWIGGVSSIIPITVN